MSITPSGPPKKRGSVGSVYRPAGRRGGSQARSLNFQKQQQELTLSERQLSRDPFALSLPMECEKLSMYRSLVELDKRLSEELDAERKSLQRIFSMSPEPLKGILRIHVYNTMTRPNDITIWSLRLQGRLVYPNFKEVYGKETIPPGYLRKFSSFFKKAVFKFPDGETKEWNKSQMPRETDGIEVKSTGNSEITVKVYLYLDTYPVRYKLAENLAEFLGTYEESQENVLQAVWEYIKLNNLQDSEETRFINNDHRLVNVFREERTDISTILSKVRNLMSELDPIEITHNVTFTTMWTDTEHLYDIEVDLEDPLQFELASYLRETNSCLFSENAFTNMMHHLKASKGRDIPTNPLDDEVRKIHKEFFAVKRELETHVEKHRNLSTFLENPSSFLNSLQDEQSELLKVISKPSFYDRVNKETEMDIKTSVFYQEEWVQRVFDKDN